MWNPRHNEADIFFTDNARISSRDEYRHMLSYGVFTTAASSALETAMETIRSVTSTPDETAYAYSLVDAALRTHQAVASAGEARLTYIMRFKATKILTGKERVAERLVYTRCFDTVASDGGGNVVDGLMSALEDKRLEVSITGAAKTQAATKFKTDKPRPDIPDKPNDKPNKPDKNKAKPKDRTGGRPLPSTDKAHKKTEADKEE
jgi:deoxyhypusine synthase